MKTNTIKMKTNFYTIPILHLLQRLNLGFATIIRGIKHNFPFINIGKVLREVLKTEGEAFQRDLANVNE